jgi:hypothetical protein
MKPCWRDMGLLEPTAKAADRILEAMIVLVTHAGYDAVKSAFDEAVFRVNVLPSRTVAYQRQYLRTNR